MHWRAARPRDECYRLREALKEAAREDIEREAREAQNKQQKQDDATKVAKEQELMWRQKVFERMALRADKNAKLNCRNDSECKKAFAIAQIYVNQKSDTKIQLATDTIMIFLLKRWRRG
jgi:hypothetical protein